jgi:hypothetical protein
MNNDIKKEALELLENGVTNQTEIARILVGKHKVTNFDHFRRTISNWIREARNPALAAECESVGIPIEDVRHGWYKGKHWSIAFRQDENGLSTEDMLKDHIEDVKKHSFSYDDIERKTPERGHLLVVDPADVHIGKLATSFETGEDYNQQIAVQRVRDGVDGILNLAAGYDIDQIIFVAGNDILHIDTPKRTTTSGTPQDTDGMWYESFLTAKRLYIEIIDKLLKIADVHFMYNPSNHDYTNGFFLAHSIEAWYKDCKNISFDISISHRKYYIYGQNMIGTTHGDGAKMPDLAKLAAVECKSYSSLSHRYIYTHHLHHKVVKDDIGCTIESLRSPSGTDSWHHRNGYQHAPKAIEGFLHDKLHGQVARFTHLF